MKETKRIISYELAKKLKDAGFPQVFKAGSCVLYKNERYIHTGGGHNGNEGLYVREGHTCCLDEYNKEDSDVDINNFIKNIEDTDLLLLPSLSELIEACGESFYSLDRSNLGWQCSGEKHIVSNFFKTPEESVANLWLKLNEK